MGDFDLARVRIQDERTRTFLHWDEMIKVGGVLKNVVTDVPVGYTGRIKTMKDFPHKDYFKRKRLGQLVWGDMSLDVWERTTSSGQVNDGPYGDGYTACVTQDLCSQVEAVAPLGHVSLSADLPNMKAVALVKAYAKMNESVLLSGELLKDFGQTATMLRRPFSSAQDLLRRMTKAKKLRMGKTAASAAKAASDTWLEYRYGWRPLLGDLEKGIEAIYTERKQYDQPRLTARACQKNSRTSNSNFTLITTLWMSRRASGSVQTVQNVSAHAGVIYSLLCGTQREQLDQILGTRPSDLPATVWECIPYSFVVDWFVGVGDWIRAVIPDPRVKPLFHWQTTVDERTHTYSGGEMRHPVSGTPYGPDPGRWGGGVTKATNIIRLCNRSMAAYPVVSINITPHRALDAAALQCQNIISGLKSFRR